MKVPTGPKARIAIAAVAVVVVGGGVAAAATQLTDDGTKPAQKPLASAVQAAISAPAVDGVTAQMRLTNHLVPDGALALPVRMLGDVTGQVYAGGGRFRVAIDTGLGPVDIAWDGAKLSAYVGPLDRVFRIEAPQLERAAGAGSHTTSTHALPTTAQLQDGLAKLREVATVSGARPTTVAGRPAYSVRIAPKHDAGLVGSAEVAWDAERGVPLRAALYASGQAQPVIALETTHIRYGSVPSADLALHAPSSAKVTDLTSTIAKHGDEARKALEGVKADVHGVDAVAARLPFDLRAPKTLVGLPRNDVRLVEGGGQSAAVVTYGSGLGRLVVIERKAGDGMTSIAGAVLPRVSIEGATGAELATALGTGLTVERNGVSYLIAGSLPPAGAEAAARALLR